MTERATTTCAAAAAVLIAIGATTGAASGDPLHRFAQSVAEYMTLRELALDDVAPLEATGDFAAVRRAVDARAAAIRQARVEARRGELFTPDVSMALRKMIRDALQANRVGAASLVDDSGEAPPPAQVNERFVWATAVATPPGVLAVLPPLPDALQYRFVGADLALVDTDADLIVDVLPDALEVMPASSR